MNPYDFVPIDFSREPDLRSPDRHEKFQGICGSLAGKITAETPIFVKSGNTSSFTMNGDEDYIIPGPSLKGLFRSLVETVANGCFGGKFDGVFKDKQRGRIDHSNKLPAKFKACSDPKNLCIACRTFGMLQAGKEGNVFSGKVSFQDAVCNKPIPHQAIYTVDLMGPKPHHTAFYLNKNKNRIAGRKFYFHHTQGLTTQDHNTDYNQYINPLDSHSEFIFQANFTNIEEDEWPALLYAIVLEPEMRHKIGYAKPSGLGSVKIEIEHIQFVDFETRYTSPTRGITEMRDDELTQYISAQIKPYTSNTTSPTLIALRHIWRWDPNDKTRYRYPSKDWFDKHQNDPIISTHYIQ